VNQLLELYSRCLKAVEGKGQEQRQQNNRRTYSACCRGRGRRLWAQSSSCLSRTGNSRAGRGAGSGSGADAGRAAAVREKYAIPVFSTVDELLASDLRLDAASVAVPTVHHHEVAAALLEAALDLLVEKPLAASLPEADELLELAAKGKRILQPGHLERFNPAVLAVEPQLRRPMFFEAHRLSVFTPAPWMWTWCWT